MPYLHTRSFKVRHYECDAYGRLSPAVYLGYMQEAAFDASAAVGYSAARYAEIGYQWLAYETEIEYLHPVHYGDTVEIKTWVMDFRRVRSLRNYELYCAGELAARATTDWVMIDTRAMYPAAIPPEIIAAYSQGEEVARSPPRAPFPPMPAAPPGTFKMHRQVEWRDIDPAAHVNNGVYIHYVVECERQALQAVGWNTEQMRAVDAVILPRRYQIEYKLAAALDDQIQLTTWVSDLGQTGGLRHTTLHRNGDGKLLAKVRSRWDWANAATGESASLPYAFTKAILPQLSTLKDLT